MKVKTSLAYHMGNNSLPEKSLWIMLLKQRFIRKYGLESVEPLSIAKLEKKYGEGIL